MGDGKAVWRHTVSERAEVRESEVCERLLGTCGARKGADSKLQQRGGLHILGRANRAQVPLQVWKKHGFDGIICPVQASPPIPNGYVTQS